MRDRAAKQLLRCVPSLPLLTITAEAPIRTFLATRQIQIFRYGHRQIVITVSSSLCSLPPRRVFWSLFHTQAQPTPSPSAQDGQRGICTRRRARGRTRNLLALTFDSQNFVAWLFDSSQTRKSERPMRRTPSVCMCVNRTRAGGTVLTAMRGIGHTPPHKKLLEIAQSAAVKAGCVEAAEGGDQVWVRRRIRHRPSLADPRRVGSQL